MGFKKISDFFLLEQIIIVSFFITTLTGIDYGHATVRDPQIIIQDLTIKLETETNRIDRAKLYCYRARQHVKLKDFKAAENDYLTALGQDMNGWIMNELGHLLYRGGQYKKAYNLAYNLEKKFPGFTKDAQKLSKKAKEKYQEEYYEENPPLITIDTTPNYGYTSRRQLIERAKQQEMAHAQMGRDEIYSQCKLKWRNDYEMVEYCIKNQSEARRTVSQLSSGGIKNRCEQKWGNDYEMVEYCIKNQSEAKRTVSQLSSGGIKNRCEQKWGNDYEMVEYCIKNQSEAKRNIERKYN